MHRNGYICKINSGYHKPDPDEKILSRLCLKKNFRTLLEIFPAPPQPLRENLIRINQTLLKFFWQGQAEFFLIKLDLHFHTTYQLALWCGAVNIRINKNSVMIF